MRIASISILAIVAGSAASGGSDLRYIDVGARGKPVRFLPSGDGGFYLVSRIWKGPGKQQPSGASRPDYDVEAIRLNADRSISWRYRFGGGDWDEPNGAAVDAQGSLIIVGGTISPDFPVIGQPISSVDPERQSVFITKLNKDGNPIFSTRLAHKAGSQLAAGGATAYAVAVDPDGNIYVTGETNVTDFPVTANALQQDPGADRNQWASWTSAFVTKLSQSGDRILYSTYLHGNSAICLGGFERCNLATHTERGLAIAVDRNGIATVSGTTNAPDFPVTQGAFQTKCECERFRGDIFITRLSADGSRLVWSTFLGGPPFGQYEGAEVVKGIALDAESNVYLAGTTESRLFPTTPNVLSPDRPPGGEAQHGFVTKVHSSGTRLEYSTYLRGSRRDDVFAIAVDAAGHAWVTGETKSTDFPFIPGSVRLGTGFVTELDIDGSRLIGSWGLPAGTTELGVAFGASAEAVVAGASGSLLGLPAAGADKPKVIAVTNSAAYRVDGRVAAGELITIYGISLGPATPVGTGLDAQGRVANELGGVRVLVDGQPAPLLYVSSSQINAVVPFNVADKQSTRVELLSASGDSLEVEMPVTATVPAIFFSSFALGTTIPVAAAVNEDGTINNLANPVGRGSVFTIWVSGAGPMNAQPTDGMVANSTDARLALPVAAMVGGRPAEVLYAGPAPGLINGFMQVNIRVPERITGADVSIIVGDEPSPRVEVSIR